MTKAVRGLLVCCLLTALPALAQGQTPLESYCALWGDLAIAVADARSLVTKEQQLQILMDISGRRAYLQKGSARVVEIAYRSPRAHPLAVRLFVERDCRTTPMHWRPH